MSSKAIFTGNGTYLRSNYRKQKSCNTIYNDKSMKQAFVRFQDLTFI